MASEILDNVTYAISGTGDAAKHSWTADIKAAGTGSLTLNTKNTYVDKNIELEVNVPAAGTEAFTGTDSTDVVTVGTAASGYYPVEATVAGTVAPATAGWQTTTAANVSDTLQVGKIAQSTMTVDGVAASSGDTVVPDTTDTQVINIAAGYYDTARTITVGAMDDGQLATINSANTAIDTVAFTHGTGNFTVSGSAVIAAPSVSQDGYISTTAGTKNAGAATLSATVDEITVGVVAPASKSVKPVLARSAKGGSDTYVDAASGAGVTVKPSAGAYVAVDAASVSDSISVEGKVSAAGYGTTTDFQKDAATSITISTEAADTLYVPIAAGTVTANGATVDTVSVAYNSTAGNFDVTGAANIPAPTVGAAGYVGNGVGTLNGAAGAAEVDASIAKIGIGATISGGDAVTPVISKNAATNVDAAAATTTLPASGKYVAVDTAALTSSVTAAAAVTSAGYGTTTAGEYTAAGDSKTVNVNASAVTYIPITEASFANASTSGHTYTDISTTAPILISGDYLYINKGYTDDVKISLAQLVPDDATITASTGAAYILDSQSAYDKDGTLVVGTIPTYDGSYTVA